MTLGIRAERYFPQSRRITSSIWHRSSTIVVRLRNITTNTGTGAHACQSSIRAGVDLFAVSRKISSGSFLLENTTKLAEERRSISLSESNDFSNYWMSTTFSSTPDCFVPSQQQPQVPSVLYPFSLVPFASICRAGAWTMP